MGREYQIISGDSHLDLAPDRWTGYVAAEWRDRAPRRVTSPSGDAFVIENRPPQPIGLSRSGWDRGTGTQEQRLQEQDQDGVDAEILFTHSAHYTFWRGIREDEGFKALIRGFNTFLAEEYCAYAPDRLIGIGVIPSTGIEDAIAELQFCARAGLKGVAIYRFPSGKGYPTADDDRFWAAALDLRMPITAHTSGGSTRFTREGPAFQYPRTPPDAAPGRDPINGDFFRFCGDAAFAPVQMAFAGVFDRFPALQIYWAETQAGWLPFSLWQIDDHWERYQRNAGAQWGLTAPKRRLSDYLRDQSLWGFLYDPLAVRLRHDAGVQALVWGSDFAHIATNWPNSRKIIDEMFAGVPDDERYAIVAGNMIRFFHLNQSNEASDTKQGEAVASGAAASA